MLLLRYTYPQALEVMAINHKNNASNKCQHSNTASQLRSHMQKTVKMSLKGKTSRKWTKYLWF